MKIYKFTVLRNFAVLLFLAAAAYGQQDFEYGKPEELKGMTTYFIDTGVDVQNRDRILKEIEKAKIAVLKLVDLFEEAQVVLIFRGAVENLETDGVRHDLSRGTGSVLVTGKNGAKSRLLLSISNSQQTNVEKKPSVKFAKEFIKAYKKANGLKE